MSKDLILEKNSELSKGLIIIPDIRSGPFGTPFGEVVEEVSEIRRSDLVLIKLETFILRRRVGKK